MWEGREEEERKVDWEEEIEQKEEEKRTAICEVFGSGGGRRGA